MKQYKLDYENGGTCVLTFFIQGDELDPSAITKDFGINPYRAWKKGDQHHRLKESYRSTGIWKMQPQCSPYDPFEEQIDLLLSDLERLSSTVNKYTSIYNSGIIVGMTFDTTNVGIELKPLLIQRLSQLHLSIDFDCYLSTKTILD